MKLNHNHAATILGWLTSAVMATAVIDWDSLDYHRPSTYFKILALALPAIGGSVSTIKQKQL